jgi:hypothetical protein
VAKAVPGFTSFVFTDGYANELAKTFAVYMPLRHSAQHSGRFY